MSTPATVLYDARCPLCTFQTRILTWLDWFRVSRMVPYDHPEASHLTVNIEPAALHSSIHCVAGNGRLYTAARALRFLCLRMPLLVPVAIVLYIPGVIYLAEFFYALVSRNRYMLSKAFGCDGACSIMPVKERDGDVLGQGRVESTGKNGGQP